MIEILPAIDIIDGKCVRLSQGDYGRRKVYDYSPDEMIRNYAGCGVKRVHLVDLDGAKASDPVNLRTLEKLASLGLVKIEWGGGIKSDAALRSVFDAGADYAIAGSIAAKDPSKMHSWLSAFGPERIILGADVRDGVVSVNGWLEDTELDIDSLVSCFLPDGLSQVICTDIGRDGMLQGPSFDLYVRLQKDYPSVDMTVSGGIGGVDDIMKLDSLGLRKVIVGKAIYENKISFRQLTELCLQRG